MACAPLQAYTFTHTISNFVNLRLSIFEVIKLVESAVVVMFSTPLFLGQNKPLVLFFPLVKTSIAVSLQILDNHVSK